MGESEMITSLRLVPPACLGPIGLGLHDAAVVVIGRDGEDDAHEHHALPAAAAEPDLDEVTVG